MKNRQHYKSLDGLRGLAALSVVLLHYAAAFAPFLIGYSITQRHSRIDHLISISPLQLPVAGGFAVCIFFVLSGFVLSLSFLKHRDNSVLISSAARRFFRLMIPAFGSIVMAYLILRLGLIYTHQSATISGSSNWLGAWWNFPAHLGQAIFQGLYGIWFGNFNYYSSYNIVLWTMHYELFGSFLIFMSLSLFGKQPNRWLFYSAFCLIFLKTYYLGFIAGMILSDVLASKPKILEQLNEKVVWASLPIAIILGTWTTSNMFELYSSPYDHIVIPFFNSSQLGLFMHMLGAVLVVVAVLKLRLLSKLFEARLLQYLGKISFSLYLTHFIVLSTLASYTFNRLDSAYGYKIALLGAVLLGLPVSFMVASLYTRYIDSPAIGLSKKCGDLLLNTRLSDIKIKPTAFAFPLSLIKKRSVLQDD